MGNSASIGFPGQSVSTAAAGPKVVVCPLCGSQKGLPLFAQSAYTLMHCDGCDLFFINPYPNSVKAHHEAVAEYDYAEMEVVRCATQYKNEKLFYDRYFSFIDAECGNATSVLDVGCGCGRLLERLAVHPHLQRAGIELNRERAAYARHTARCEVFETPIEDLDGSRRFDVITLINVISHVPNINNLFETLRSRLADHGRVIIKTGEMKSDVRKSAIFDWEFPDHLQFLGWRTADYICARNGFRIRKRLRTALSQERFAAATWRMQGRSGLRNLIKAGIARTPFALAFLAACYEAMHHGSISSSFIVLEPE